MKHRYSYCGRIMSIWSRLWRAVGQGQGTMLDGVVCLTISVHAVIHVIPCIDSEHCDHPH